jgi:BirA family biotin operon repressor/biotin-[acetyl-CoA-carboxylase] ligase
VTHAAAPRVVRLDRTGSTMDELHELAQSGAPAGTAVVAAEQVAGRGSRGRVWTSPRGGLWLSVLARPVTPGLELLSLRAGLAVAERLAEPDIGVSLGLKWPNDLMLGERKAGGILCEARWQGEALAWVAIGVGINVTNPPPAAVATAARLADATPGLTADALVRPVVTALQAVDAAAGPLTAAELARFARRDWLFGRALGTPIPGRAAGITASGALRVCVAPDRLVDVRTGTIELATTSSAEGR